MKTFEEYINSQVSRYESDGILVFKKFEMNLNAKKKIFREYSEHMFEIKHLTSEQLYNLYLYIYNKPPVGLDALEICQYEFCNHIDDNILECYCGARICSSCQRSSNYGITENRASGLTDFSCEETEDAYRFLGISAECLVFDTQDIINPSRYVCTEKVKDSDESTCIILTQIQDIESTIEFQKANEYFVSKMKTIDFKGIYELDLISENRYIFLCNLQKFLNK